MPFTFLWLPNPVDEVVFARRYAEKHFESRDLLFRTIRACVLPVFLTVRLWQHGFGMHGLMALLNVTTNVLVECMGFDWQRDKRGGKRTAMAVMTRIVILFTQAMDGNSMAVVVQTTGSMVRFLLVQSGLLALLVCNIGVPLLMKHHLVVNATAIVAMGIFTMPDMCAVAVSSPESGPVVVAVWQFINAVFTGGVIENDHVPVPLDACQSVVTMTHFVFGLLVPSFAMWAVEYEERLDFSPGNEFLTNNIMRKQMLLFFPVMGCLWLLLNFRLWL